MIKLYTEEQVRKIYDLSFSNLDQDGSCIIDEDEYFKQILKTLTPIELPSDEEIEKEAWKHFSFPLNKDGVPMTQPVGHNPHGSKKFIKAFIKGYKAALEQILKQNK